MGRMVRMGRALVIAVCFSIFVFIRVDSCPFVVETPLLSAAGITRFHRFTMQVRGNVGEDLTTNEHEFPRMPDEETFFVGWKSV